MNIRGLNWLDKPKVDDIYKEFYTDNEYPNFYNIKEFPCTFVVTDDNDKIIVAGGIKTIAEAVFVTDKNLSRKVRLDALLQGLGSSIFIAQGMNHRHIHAFVNNDLSYTRVLQKFGFKLIDAKLLVLDFGDLDGKTKTA